MTKFERFKDLQAKRMAAVDTNNTRFVFEGYPSTTITCGTTSYEAAVVNKQEKDMAYVYTKLAETLTVGSVWTAKTLHLLITENIVVIKDVKWNKYTALLANLQLGTNWAYWKGPEETYINTTLQEKSVILSQQKPILVLPNNLLDVEDKVVINGRAWMVQEKDEISTPGISYCSLKASTVSKEEIASHTGQYAYIVEKQSTSYTITETQTPVAGSNVINTGNNINITLTTVDGYFAYNKKVNIKSRSAQSVTFSIPFGVDDVEIKTKGDNDTIITNVYHIV